MDVFLSYASSDLRETRDLLSALERSFGRVDWISADNVDGSHPLPFGRMSLLDNVMRAWNREIILLLMSRTSEKCVGYFNEVSNLVRTSANYKATLVGLLENHNPCLVESNYYSTCSLAERDQSRGPMEIQLFRREPPKYPEDVIAAMHNCVELPALGRSDLSLDTSGLRIVTNMARSIRPFEGAALRRMKSMAMLRVLASQALSKTDKLHFDWRQVESFILQIKPPIVWKYADGLRETQDNEAAYAIGTLRAAPGELSRLFTGISEEIAFIKRKYQPEHKAWFVSVSKAANHVLKHSGRVRTYSVAKIKELSRNVERFRPRRRLHNLGDSGNTTQSESLAQLFRGSERLLGAGAELRHRTATLVRNRSLASPVPRVNQPLEQDTVFSLYRGFNLPDTVFKSWSGE